MQSEGKCVLLFNLPVFRFRLNIGVNIGAASLTFVGLLMTQPPARAQRVVASLPDAPAPKQQANHAQQKPKSGIDSTVDLLSRRSFFFPELAYTEGSLTAKQKFELAVDKSVSPASFVGAAAAAGISQADNSWPGYGQGAEGYGKRVAATMALSASGDMFGTFFLSSIARHDPRYFVSQGSTARKIGHAIRRVLLTRTDSGGETANWSGLGGILAAEGLANAYLPDAERTSAKTFERFGIHVGVIAGGNLAKEFWPQIFKSLMPKGGSHRAGDLKDSPAKPQA